MKKKQELPSEYAVFLESTDEAQAEALRLFFDDLSKRCTLSRKGRALLKSDFERAILYYHSIGVPLATALARLSVERLGGFYVRPPVLWYTLDDAAKIYSLSMQPGRMAVFRLSVYLDAPVAPALLQMALNFTIKRFPSFATTLKKGFFWHYLDTAKRRYSVLPETGVPCQPMNLSYSASQSFRVLWHENRVSVEFFHSLTDGTGGMSFLKALTAEYLRLCGVESGEEGLLRRDEPHTLAETQNQFHRSKVTEKSGGFVDAPATQMSGRLSRTKPCRVLHLCMDAGSLKQAAKAHGATITAYVLSKLFLAGKLATDEPTGTISIQVPVNMRKFYPSETIRNFALYCGIRLPIADIADGPALTEEISAQLAEKAGQQAMREMMNATQKLVKALRFVPLIIKVPAARIVYGFLADRIFSNTLSNLGVVTMPPGYAAHIRSMDFVLGTAITNRASCTLVTFGNTATLTVAKQTDDPTFEEALLRLLSDDGLSIQAEGSPLYEN